METLSITHPDYKIYLDFARQHNLQIPVLESDDQAAQMFLSFDQGEHNQKDLHHKALYHFDMSFADLTMETNPDTHRVTLTFEF